MDYINYLSKWIKDQVKLANAKGVVVGISGGIDSAVTVAIAKKAFPENTIGIIMPVGNMSDIEDARLVAKSLEIKTREIDLTSSFEEIKKTISVSNDMAIANMKPRLRMTTAYAIAQENSYLVLGTDNAAEILLGYFTKYGDGGVDLLPLAKLRKEQVFELAVKLGIDNSIINKAPSAGLFEGQTDEKEIGVSYKEIDAYLNGQEISAVSKEIIEKLKNKNQHKLVEIPKPDQGL